LLVSNVPRLQLQIAESGKAMSIDACQFFYDCTGCGRVLRPKPGDYCEFCSYGDVPCPSMQACSDEAAILKMSTSRS
jgi:rRNA maturation endonuclease Nob1